MAMRYVDDPALAWGHPARVFDLAFSPASADVVASGAEDGTARVWRRSAENPHKWKQTVCCYGGHSSEVLRVAWHPSGRLLATGGAEGAVRLWRADGLADGGGEGGGGGEGAPSSSSSSSAAVTYAPPTDPLDSEHPEEIYAMIFASRGGGGSSAPSQAASNAEGGGGGAGADVSGGELLLTASAEALYVWDLETGKLLQGAPSPEARVLGTGAERVAMPPWRGPRTGRAGGAGGEAKKEEGASSSSGGGGENENEDDDDDEQGPPANYPTEMPVYVFGMAQVGGAAPPAPSLLAAGCCDGTLRLWAFEAAAARVRPLFAAQAHAPGDMASFVSVLAPQSESNPAGGGQGAVGSGGPYVVSVSRGGQATVFDARKLVAAGATAGAANMTPREALSAGVVQRHWLDGPTMGGAAVAGAGGKGGRPLMLATVGADGRARCYEARALLQPAPPDSDDEGGDDHGRPRGPSVLRPARILRTPGPALRAPLLAVAASADGGTVAAAGFPVEAGSLSREEQRLERARAEAAAGGGGCSAARSVRRGGGGASAAAVAAGRRRRDRPAVGTATAVLGGGGGGGGGGGDADDEGGLFAALTIGTSFAASAAAARKGDKEEGGDDEEEEDGAGAERPKCEGESIAARAAVFVWRLGDD